MLKKIERQICIIPFDAFAIADRITSQSEENALLSQQQPLKGNNILTPQKPNPLIFTKFLFLFHSNSNNNNIKAEVNVFAHTAPNHSHGYNKTFEIGWQVFILFVVCVFLFFLRIFFRKAFIIYFLFFCFLSLPQSSFPSKHYVHSLYI